MIKADIIEELLNAGDAIAQAVQELALCLDESASDPGVKWPHARKEEAKKLQMMVERWQRALDAAQLAESTKVHETTL